MPLMASEFKLCIKFGKIKYPALKEYLIKAFSGIEMYMLATVVHLSKRFSIIFLIYRPPLSMRHMVHRQWDTERGKKYNHWTSHDQRNRTKEYKTEWQCKQWCSCTV